MDLMKLGDGIIDLTAAAVAERHALPFRPSRRNRPTVSAKPSGTLVERILSAIGVPEHEKERKTGKLQGDGVGRGRGECAIISDEGIR